MKDLLLKSDVIITPVALHNHIFTKDEKYVLQNKKKHIIKNITAEIVDPADGIIKELGTSYNLKHVSGLPKINFYITGDVEKFKVLSGRFLRTVYFRGYYFKMDLETKKYHYFR